MGRKNKNKYASSHQGGLGQKTAPPSAFIISPSSVAVKPALPRESLSLIRLRTAMSAIEHHKTNAFLKAAEAAPFIIRANGLGTGLAMLAADKSQQSKDLTALVSEWLLKGCEHSPLFQGKHYVPPNEDWFADALRKITASSRDQYRAAQTEALGYATVLKRLAQAFCPASDEGGAGA